MPFYVVQPVADGRVDALVFTKGLNLGVDFVGGQMIRVTFEQSATAPVAELREMSARSAMASRPSRQFGKPNEISIRMQLPEGSDGDRGDRRCDGPQDHRDDQGDPSRRADRRRRIRCRARFRANCSRPACTRWASRCSAISIYIWFRFEWQFGVGALFALVHDVTLTLGLFALTQMEFDLNIVAALLTLIGYSLNDTIVVYDRIRENLKKYRRMPMPELLDLSVNETLSRTVVTSLSMLITLVALLCSGPT